MLQSLAYILLDNMIVSPNSEAVVDRSINLWTKVCLGLITLAAKDSDPIKNKSSFFEHCDFSQPKYLMQFSIYLVTGRSYSPNQSQSQKM